MPVFATSTVIRLGRAANEQALHALQDASSQWLCVLYWLERLASDTRHPLDDEHHAVLRSFFEEATVHLQRLGVLTQQEQDVCMLGYQRCGMLLSQQEQEEVR